MANQKNCSFRMRQIKYLGNIIPKEGVGMDPKKVDIVKNWPVPKSMKGVLGVFGLTRYYQKFVKQYGKIGPRLTDLFKKDGFQ